MTDDSPEFSTDSNVLQDRTLGKQRVVEFFSPSKSFTCIVSVKVSSLKIVIIIINYFGHWCYWSIEF